MCRSNCFEKNSSSVDTFILNKFLHQNIQTIQKNYVFSRSGCAVEVFLWKSSYSEKKNNCHKKATVLEKKFLEKTSCSEEISAPKKQVFCRSSYSEEMWRSNFSKNIAVLKKLLHIREGGISNEYWSGCQGQTEATIRLCLCHTIFIMF